MIVPRAVIVLVTLAACSSKRTEATPPPTPPPIAASIDAALAEAPPIDAALAEAPPLDAAIPIDAGLTQLTTEEIDRVMKSHGGLLRACYQKELERKPRLQGKAVVHFEIAPDGSVTLARIDRTRSTTTDDELEGCLLRTIERLHFPAKGGGTVNYPFIFARQE